MSPRNQVLPPAFYSRDPVTVARALLGQLLVCNAHGAMMVGCIVETEAYLASGDSANHSYGGPTARNAAMFGPPGHAYVYAMHRYCCLNVVTEAEGVPSAVLLRAVEPRQGLEVMQARRRTDRHTNLTSGPGKLCQAFGLDRTWDTWDLTQGQGLWLAAPASDPGLEIAVTTRVGVTSAQDLLLRFYAPASSCVSRKPRTHTGP